MVSRDADHVDQNARRRPVEAEAHDAIDVARLAHDLASPTRLSAVADVAEHDLARSSASAPVAVDEDLERLS